MSVDEAVAKSMIISNLITNPGSRFHAMAEVSQEKEEELFLELMWIENLCVPANKRDLATGLLLDCETTCKASADVLPLFNDTSGSKTIRRIEEMMAKLYLKFSVNL